MGWATMLAAQSQKAQNIGLADAPVDSGGTRVVISETKLPKEGSTVSGPVAAVTLGSATTRFALNGEFVVSNLTGGDVPRSVGTGGGLIHLTRLA
jgi:hypothetical protein